MSHGRDDAGAARGALDACAERIRALTGADPPRDAGVLHVASAWRSPRGELLTLRIGPDTPRSGGDAFALDLCRARADAILTTGRILREEPALTHALGSQHAEALRAWRAARLGRPAPPRTAVLTSGRALDFGHPLFARRDPEAAPPWIVTGRAAAQRLAADARRAGADVMARDAPGLRDALAALRAHGCRAVCVEAGPSSSASLYQEPLASDELLLSVFEAPRLAASLRGGPLPDEERLDALFGTAPHRHDLREPSGPWSFLCWRRPARPLASAGSVE